jgi:hypothetical protein
LEIDIKIIKKTPAPDVPKLPTQSQQDKAMQVFDIIQDEL